jgi:hypothetical protein
MMVEYETYQANIDCITQLRDQSQIDQQQVSQNTITVTTNKYNVYYFEYMVYKG